MSGKINMQGGNPFWMTIKSNFSMDDKIADIIKSPDATVEELLHEESTVQEIRNGNEKVIEFLLKKKNMRDLLRYILEEPPQDSSHERGHKFPFMVSEIFGISMNKLVGIFFSDEPEEEDAEDSKNEDDEEDEVTTEGEEEKEQSKEDSVNMIKTLLKVGAKGQREPEKETTDKKKDEEDEDDEELKEKTEQVEKSEEKVEDKEEKKETKGEEVDDEQKDVQNEENSQENTEEITQENSQESSQEKPADPVKEEDSKVGEEEKSEEKEDSKENEETSTPANSTEDVSTPKETEEAVEAKTEDSKEEDVSEPKTESSEDTETKEETEKENTQEEPKEDAKEEEAVKQPQSDEKVEAEETPKEEAKEEVKKDSEETTKGEEKEATETKESEPSISTEEKVIEKSEESVDQPKEVESTEKEPIADEEGQTENTQDASNPVEEVKPEKPAEEGEQPEDQEEKQEESKEPAKEIDPILQRPITEYLIDFIRTEEELNPVLCGYFCKLLNTVITQNKERFYTYLFTPENSMIGSLTRHVYNRSIADLFIRIIKDCNEKEEVKLSILNGIISGIPGQEYEGKLNSAHILKELMEVKAILDLFKGEEINTQLFDLLEIDDEMTIRTALDILNHLYKKFPFYTAKKTNEGEEDEFSKNYLGGEEAEEMVILPHIDKLLNDKLPIVDKILSTETSNTLQQQYGERIQPFGAIRMGITKFIASIIAVGNQDYALKLSICLPSLLQYCVKYPWNTMLHNSVEQIFEEIFKTGSKYKDDIRTALIVETSVTDFITECATETEMKDSGRKIRSGIIATVIKIANVLNNHTSEYVQEELNKDDKWVEFVNTELKYSNENNERALAGHQSKTGDSDEESANYETSMDKLFAAFTSLKDSHDSSRELSDSDEDEEEDQNTDNILKGIDSSSEKSEDSDSAEAPKASEKPSEPSPEAEQPLEEEKSEEAPDAQAVSPNAPEDGEEIASSEHSEEVSKDPKESPSSAPASVQEEGLEEDNTYYDNSFWDIPQSQSLEDLLSDA